MEKGESKRIGYLVSEYPAVSHTFIFREIKVLRTLGFEIYTASIRKPSLPERMTKEEKEESENTFYVLGVSFFNILKSLISLILFRPGPFLKMFFFSLGPVRKSCIGLLKSIFYFVEALILLDWAVKNKINHIHVHFANPAATVAMIASESGLIDFSMSVHGPDIFYNVEKNMLKEKIKKSKFVRCISYFSRSQLMMLVPYEHWNKFHIVRCGIDPKDFSPRPLPDKKPYEILCLGRLVPAKGQHILIEAFKELRENNINCHLTFVGGGGDMESLKREAENLGLSNYITFTGPVSPNKVHEYYDKAHVFVLPSFAEGVPVVLMEAMSKEIPVVSTRITGIPELIEHNVSGLLSPPSDSKDLARNIERVLKDKEFAKRLGSEGRRKVIDKYNLEENCKMMGEVFGNVV